MTKNNKNIKNLKINKSTLIKLVSPVILAGIIITADFVSEKETSHSTNYIIQEIDNQGTNRIAKIEEPINTKPVSTLYHRSFVTEIEQGKINEIRVYELGNLTVDQVQLLMTLNPDDKELSDLLGNPIYSKSMLIKNDTTSSFESNYMQAIIYKEELNKKSEKQKLLCKK